MSSSDYALLKKAIRNENQREKISKHQEMSRSAAKHKLAVQRHSLEQNRQIMIQQTNALSPEMQQYYHERLAQLAGRAPWEVQLHILGGSVRGILPIMYH